MTIWVLGDQLTNEAGPLARADADEPVLFVEAHGFARRHAYHPHKLALVFSAMRHFAADLREAGHEVTYERAETFDAGLEAHFEANPGDELVAMRPASHGAGERLTRLVDSHGGTLSLVANETFLCSPSEFDAWAGDDETYSHESFYRFMRHETGYLMDGDEPVGGEWNYDSENREFPGADYDPPAPPTFAPDEMTGEVLDWVSEEFDGSYDEAPYGGAWADPGAFVWPVTRDQAREALAAFVEERLPTFGDFQDAMLGDEWALNHALLGSSLNLGLLRPGEVVEAAIEAHEERDLPLNSVEGFVRQVVGWREFVRHVYRRTMPDLAGANQLGAEEDLPDFYWTGETEMACLADVVDGVRTRGYSHHIERLMVLSNFGLTYGVEPAQLNEWFHAAYVDAYHWVTTPNVIEMGLFGAGAFASKPYAASANYIDGMSDHCADCAYAKTKTTGENACPFNALYWEFLGRNEERLRANGRMGLVYNHWDNKEDDERDAIRERAREIRALAADGDL